MTDMHHFTILF